jgi:cytochrome c oxidase assembly protein subunit 11
VDPTLIKQGFFSPSYRSFATQAQKAAYDYYRRKKESSIWYKLGFNRSKSQASREERNVQVAWYALSAVIGALGATYAAVPLYKVFCQTTGFGGTTQRVVTEREPTVLEKMVAPLVDMLPNKGGGGTRVHTWTDPDAAERLANLKPVENAPLLTIHFDTTVDGQVLPWSFVPVQNDVKVVPGETALCFFRVTNHSDQAITGVATYNVHPGKVGLYFQKIQCFCFEEQRLLPGETVDMPGTYY